MSASWHWLQLVKPSAGFMTGVCVQGGKLIWIAPSGGRDRPKEGRWTPDAFDPSAVELMRQLGAKACPAAHAFSRRERALSQ